MRALSQEQMRPFLGGLVLSLNAERVILSRVQCEPEYSNCALYPGPPKSATLGEEAEGDLSTACGVCKHTVDLRYF